MTSGLSPWGEPQAWAFLAHSAFEKHPAKTWVQNITFGLLTNLPLLPTPCQFLRIGRFWCVSSQSSQETAITFHFCHYEVSGCAQYHVAFVVGADMSFTQLTWYVWLNCLSNLGEINLFISMSHIYLTQGLYSPDSTTDWNLNFPPSGSSFRLRLKYGDNGTVLRKKEKVISAQRCSKHLKTSLCKLLPLYTGSFLVQQSP
jgi:hypothetical protein